MDSRTEAFAACPDTGCDWGSFYLGWKASREALAIKMEAELSALNITSQQLRERVAENQTMKTSELIGAALDWAVAKARGFDEIRVFPPGRPTDRGWIEVRFNPEPKASTTRYDPSISWAYGGPIIERECIGLLFDSGSACRKPCWFATPDDQSTSCGYEGEVFDSSLFMVDECAGMYGPTPLIAAMRCYVASKLGDEVEVPDELCE